MDSLRSGLAEWGVPESQVYFELFTKPAAKAATPAATTNEATQTAEVVLAKSGKTATWSTVSGTLLEFAKDQGPTPDIAAALASA
ncbi:hypothetical protein IQ254_29295 [Nodosilinea sp. LEGE 07088]|uniref:hypothetical protein n=1 Tax=Nodosilinea sp. LEGE 07088 TaxID=2777968 RepID=UPI0018820ABD|nr:hypothetical protein [Nodosilinea sp. LEGE 07088]MBE9141248.1 hypothetical protein [Nodosilinea sp. LEGE 07088]